ncbi:Hypothetical protein PBC10988_27370 [Planctomycetales bacterium 10988]|nr:Hypothetical protein PBC10988_27370 [Planctomycetales bacterium 10988]
MAKDTTFRLARCVGGYCQFAKVSVGWKQDHPNADEFSHEKFYCQLWYAAAQRGVLHGLRLLKSDERIAVTLILGTECDTTEKSVFAAAAMATIQLHGEVNRYDLYYEEKEWKVAEKKIRFETDVQVLSNDEVIVVGANRSGEIRPGKVFQRIESFQSETLAQCLELEVCSIQSDEQNLEKLEEGKTAELTLKGKGYRIFEAFPFPVVLTEK